MLKETLLKQINNMCKSYIEYDMLLNKLMDTYGAVNLHDITYMEMSEFFRQELNRRKK